MTEEKDQREIERGSLEDKMSSEIDWVQTLADDPEFAEDNNLYKETK